MQGWTGLAAPRLPPPRHSPMNADTPDLDACASEPIRVPGAIQPHGRLLVLGNG